jgi:Malectin domain
MASWNNHVIQTPLDARFQLGLDQHSLAADPLFIDPATGNYHLRSNSPAIDAGDPATPYLLEPAPNGDRVNLGFDGNTPQAAPSPTQMLQVLSPSGFDKLVEGEPATITWRSYGIAAERPVMFINAGGSAVTGPQAWSSWITDPNGTLLGHQWTSLPIDTSGIDLPAPQAVYQTVAQVPNGIGNKLDYSLDLPDGDYIVRLHFSEEGGPFDILINGAVAASNFDIAAAEGTAGAVVERFTATASGGQGLHIQLVNRTFFGATLAGIEISQVEHFGSATATAKVEVSPDGGNSWQLVTSSAPFDRYGYGSGSFAPTFQTVGNDALVRVTSGAGTDTSHGEFLVANAGHAYYINDGSTAGDEYTTAVGNDRNSGKSPDQPMATLSALLAAYPLGPGDIVYVDTGHYSVLRDIVIGPSVSGNGDDPGQRVTIQGPTQGADKAVFDRGDTSDNTAVFHIAGADFLTLANLDITDGTRGIWVTNNTGTTIGLRISGSDIFGNELYDVEIGGATARSQSIIRVCSVPGASGWVSI